MLEELGIEYKVHEVNIGKNEQYEASFLEISPNNKIPVIIDSNGPGGIPFRLFETGAILIYLAEKIGSELLPSDPIARAITIQWLMFQMGGVGPMFGQAHVFLFKPKEDVPLAADRYHKETKRLYSVMNQRLGEVKYLAGEDYTIADIATYPWVQRKNRHFVELEEYSNVKQWYDDLSERPAVKKGMAVPFYNE
jgi:GST-like protein